MNHTILWQVENKEKQYEIYKRIPFKNIKCTHPENNTTFIFKDTCVSI